MRNLPQRVGKSAEATWRTPSAFTASIISVRGCQPEFGLAASFEMKDGILLGSDGDTIVCRGTETPSLERRQNLAVQSCSHALENLLVDDFAALINRDLDHHIPL